MHHTLADVHNNDIAAIWVKVYSCLRDEEVRRGMLVCKTFEKLLPSQVKDVTYCSPEPRGASNQARLRDLEHSFHSLASFTVYQEHDDHNPVVDWSQVVLPHPRHLDLIYCPLSSGESTAPQHQP